ncbi:MAG: hypothetical protein JJ974_03905 [Phycisphaerales bacterium]|nr:hypothetical protein [Phycisphaerales bacterium]
MKPEIKDLRAILTAMLIALCSFTSSSTAQYIQLEVQGGIDADEYITVAFRAIFDTNAPPDGVVPGSTITFNAIWAEMVDPSVTARVSPMVVGDEEIYEPATARLLYVETSNRYIVTAFIGGSPPVQFVVRDPIGRFTTDLPSLPPVLSWYDVDPSGPNAVIELQAEFSTTTWTPGDDNGGFIMSVRNVDGPPMPECIADLNNDGVLDFFDVSAYIQLYTNGCP